MDLFSHFLAFSILHLCQRYFDNPRYLLNNKLIVYTDKTLQPAVSHHHKQHQVVYTSNETEKKARFEMWGLRYSWRAIN